MPAVRLLGTLEVRDPSGVPLPLGRRKQRALLALLAARANTVVRTEEIADMLWGERPPQSARANLYTYVSQLRKVFSRAMPDRSTGPLSTGAGYRLNLAPDACDVAAFEALVAGGRKALFEKRPAVAAEHLARALALWRGDVLEDLIDEEWVGVLAVRLNEARLAAQEHHVDARLALGQYADLVAELMTATSLHPLRERAWAQLMEALYRTGRGAQAMMTYQRMRDVFRREIGVDPGPEVQRLRNRIRAGLDGRNDLSSGCDPAVDASAKAESTEVVNGSSIVPWYRPVPEQLPAAAPVFVGRRSELAVLSSAIFGSGRLSGTAVVTAMGGVGKTWLALHWGHRNRYLFPDGQLFIDLRGFDPCDEPMPVAVAVRGFLDALGVPPVAVPPDLDAQLGLYRSLVSGRQMLILLDNARDAAQAARLLPGSPTCATIITSRDTLSSLVSRHGARPVALDNLDDGSALDLLERRLGTPHVAQHPAEVATVVQACDGLPLALGIAAARAAERAGQSLAAAAAELSDEATRLDALDRERPHGLRNVLSWSLRALTAEHARAFTILGVWPCPDISAPAAGALLDLPAADLAAVLSVLEQQSLLVQQVPRRWRMHDLVRIYAAERADRYVDVRTRNEAVTRLVDHYVTTAQAADYLFEPLRGPVDSGCSPQPGTAPFADEAAAWRWYEDESACLVPIQRLAIDHGNRAAAWRLALFIDVYLRRRGRLRDRLTVWHLALRSADDAGDVPAQALSRRFLGSTYATVGQHDEALEQLRLSLDLVERSDDIRARAHTHRALSSAYGTAGHDRMAYDHAVTAAGLYQSLNDHQLAHALNGVGWYAARLGRYPEAQRMLDQALSLARRDTDHGTELNVLDSLGYLAHRTDRPHDAIGYFELALSLARKLGHAFVEAEVLEHLGDSHATIGDWSEGVRHWAAAADLYRVQHRPGDATRVGRRLALPSGEPAAR